MDSAISKHTLPAYIGPVARRAGHTRRTEAEDTLGGGGNTYSNPHNLQLARSMPGPWGSNRSFPSAVRRKVPAETVEQSDILIRPMSWRALLSGGDDAR